MSCSCPTASWWPSAAARGSSRPADSNFTGGDQRLKQVELLRPGLDTAWRLGPAQQKWRAYHSTALLLPDGRVLSAGDDYWHLGDDPRPQGGDPMDVGEIYSPPYLFDGDELAPRPTIEDAPAEVPYGAPFGDQGTRSRRARCSWRPRRRRTART